MSGNEIRFERARQKRLIESGLLNPAEVLRRPDPCWNKASALELLTSMHRVGKSRAKKWLIAEGIDPSTPIISMNELQRFRLAKHVEAALRRAENASA